MRIFLSIILAIFSFIVLVAIIAMLLPRGYKVERAVHIHGPFDLVWEQTVDFKNFQEWSPWSKIDPNMQVEFSGSSMTVGASYSWIGNKEAGSGKMEITSLSKDRVDVQLFFKEPFDSEATTHYIFEQLDGSVEVIWGMEGRMPWPMNLLNFILKKSIGKDYAEGLHNLQIRCETMAAAQPEIIENEEITPIE